MCDLHSDSIRFDDRRYWSARTLSIYCLQTFPDIKRFICRARAPLKQVLFEGKLFLLFNNELNVNVLYTSSSHVHTGGNLVLKHIGIKKNSRL